MWSGVQFYLTFKHNSFALDVFQHSFCLIFHIIYVHTNWIIIGVNLTFFKCTQCHNVLQKWRHFSWWWYWESLVFFWGGIVLVKRFRTTLRENKQLWKCVVSKEGHQPGQEVLYLTCHFFKVDVKINKSLIIYVFIWEGDKYVSKMRLLRLQPRIDVK